jgi:hypothetical protein
MSYLSDLLGDSYKEGMTEEEISVALEAKNTSDAANVTKLKNLLNKANSEAAEYKKQLRDKLTDDQKAEAERKEAFDKLVKDNEELKRSIALTTQVSKLVALGYDTKLAEETATAMVDGDMEKVITNQGIFLEAQKKSYEADLMRNTPHPKGGTDSTGKVLDYGKLIEEAQANGNYAEAAYYTRLSQENATGENNN